MLTAASFLFAVSFAVGFAEPMIAVDSEKNTVRVGEYFQIRVTVEGEDLGEVVLPESPDFEIRRQPVSSSESQHIQVINGNVQNRQSIAWTYLCKANRAGELTISGIKIDASGKTIEAAPISIEVVEGASESDSQRSGNNDNNMGRSEKVHTFAWEDLIFVQSNVDKMVAYENEPIVLTWEVWRLLNYPFRVEPARTARVQLPTTEGFYASEPMQRQERREKGKFTYDVYVTTQLLYPTSPGEKTIGPFIWQGSVWAETVQGIDRNDMTLPTDSINIQVRELPTPPPNFSGAVGKFELEASLAKTQTLQGVPVDLTVTVRGSGNPDAIGAPTLPDMEGVYVSEPDVVEKKPDDALHPVVSKTWTFKLTPTKAEQLNVPPVRFTYFDSEAAKYETKSSGGFTLEVLPAVTEGSRVVAGGDSGQPDAGTTAAMRPSLTINTPLIPDSPPGIGVFILVLLAPASYAGIAWYFARRRRFETDTAFARAHQARTKRLKMLDAVHHANDPAQELYRAVVGFVGDLFNAEDPGMTPQDVRALCESHAIPNEVIESLVKILRACERVRYASGVLSPQEIDALIQASELAFDQLESARKQGVHA